MISKLKIKNLFETNIEKKKYQNFLIILEAQLQNYFK